MIKIISTILAAIFIFTGCGFKVIKKSELINFSIAEIDTSGDKRINYKLKNKLLLFSKNKDNKIIYLNIISEKNKKIKEKNTNNEISKYEMTINISLEIKDDNGKLLDKISISEKSEYKVAKYHSTTRKNEKEEEAMLVNILANKILDEIAFKLNDL
jgi:outer membrane lipopolysaccharide assembly protein LptE/RlpB